MFAQGLLSAVFTAAMLGTATAVDTWGGSVSLGPTTSTIIKAVTTLTPGRAPQPQNGFLTLWPGMSNGTGHLVQSTLESWADNSWCGAAPGEWCVRASLFGSFGQLDGPASPVSASQKVKIVYTLLEDNDTWRQDVTDADSGAQLSVFEYKSGPYMRGYGTGTECNMECSPTVDEQYYRDTVITLAGPDPNFGKTISTAQGATYEGLSSNADGSVWTIKTIHIKAMV